MKFPKVKLFDRNIGSTIRTLRLARKWTQEELSKKTGYTPICISSIENNRLYVNDYKLRELAKAFDLTEDELKLLALTPRNKVAI